MLDVVGNVLRLAEEEPEWEPWEVPEPQLLFSFHLHGRCPSRRQARRSSLLASALGPVHRSAASELAPLTRHDATGITIIIREDEEKGRRLKTASSRQAVPVHPELVKLGFVDLVEGRCAIAETLHRSSRSSTRTAGRIGLVKVVWAIHPQYWHFQFSPLVPRVSAQHQGRALRTGGVSEDQWRSPLRRWGGSELRREGDGAMGYPSLDLSHLHARRGQSWSRALMGLAV